MAQQTRDAARTRPLSPHWQVYRWPVTMATSIVHRATGIALTGGSVILCWWLFSLASGEEAYATFSFVARSIGGQIILFLVAWALSFHLFNGIRHLAWDLGFGFTVPTANRTGVLVVALSLFSAIAALAYAYLAKGL